MRDEPRGPDAPIPAWLDSRPIRPPQSAGGDAGVLRGRPTLETLADAVREQPGNPHLHLALGRAYLEAEQPGLVLEEYGWLVANWPDGHDQMLVELRNFIARYPRAAPAHRLLGDLFLAVRRFAEAANEFLRAADLS